LKVFFEPSAGYLVSLDSQTPWCKIYPSEQNVGIVLERCLVIEVSWVSSQENLNVTEVRLIAWEEMVETWLVD
jgi:hypothetical protein